MTLSDSINVYGKSLPPKSRNTVNLKLQKTIGFNYPASTDPYRGYFSKQTGIDLIRNNLRQLLRTEPGERFMLPNYGCSLRRYLMEPLDQITFSQIRDTIKNSIYKYLSKVSIIKLSVVETVSAQIKINLFCRFNDDEIINFDTNFKI